MDYEAWINTDGWENRERYDQHSAQGSKSKFPMSDKQGIRWQVVSIQDFDLDFVTLVLLLP